MRALLPCLAVCAALTSCGGSHEPVDSLPATPTAHDGWESAYIDTNGVRLHYWRTDGGGEPVMVMAQREIRSFLAELKRN